MTVDRAVDTAPTTLYENYEKIVEALKLPKDENGLVLSPMPFWKEILWHIRKHMTGH